MDLRKITRLYHTVKHLKFTQVYHQIKYRLVRARRPVHSTNGEFVLHNLVSSPTKAQTLVKQEGIGQFRFLNLEKSFDLHNIDWSFHGHGMLWTYNLNYFDCLHQKDMGVEAGLDLLGTFYDTVDQNPIALHPYPTSLRIINVSKFVCKWNVRESWLHEQVVADLKLLKSRLEFHLLANHLLENAFALYIGGLTTGQSNILEAGRKLLAEQLEEQILDDGMHYERSPMYHMIILERLLDTLNFAKAINDELAELLTTYARKMVSLAMNWNGLERIPMMQDSAYGVAFSVPVILKYSQQLLDSHYPTKTTNFKSSGYRVLKSDALYCFINAGTFNPKYQPGHGHADELNFELFFNGYPVIVDTGVTTYEPGPEREAQRSTTSHNCVTINEGNSSDVWSSFRVGRRAKVELFEKSGEITVSRTDYASNAIVKRIFKFQGDDFIIEDQINNSQGDVISEGRLHFHPAIKLFTESDYSFRLQDKKGETYTLTFQGHLQASISRYSYSEGFNKSQPAVKLMYTFDNASRITLTKTK